MDIFAGPMKQRMREHDEIDRETHRERGGEDNKLYSLTHTVAWFSQ